mgnify:CR=1 FL=1|tara:strand:- start:2526 stop:2813 length:288 start_codon:yes stop_codon:yes gene_type:complete
MSTRYKSDSVINRGSSFGTAKAANQLRAVHKAGGIATKTIVLGKGARLDHVAFTYLGDPTYWWTIAVLSGIGWGMQLPADTMLIVPTKIEQIKRL